MAKIPVSSEVRRFSEGKYGSRPQSRAGNRPPSSRSVDSPLPAYTNDKTQAAQHRTNIIQSQPHVRGSLLRRHTSEDISHGHEFSLGHASFVPRPPSRTSSEKLECRPKSAKGRLRPRSGLKKESIASRENFQVVGEQASFPTPLRSQSSFSKYKPLPSIGSGQKVESDSNKSQLVLEKTFDNRDDSVLLQKTATLLLENSLPNEPDDSEPGRIHLAIKLLDGSRHERWFRNTETLGTVLAFAQSCSKDRLPLCQFFTNEVPRQVFNNFDVSLTQAGINSRTVLHLEDI
ncbi:unnamed protein product [Pocillopora meandrina]|uniref:UBX domain-containing protein n=1 Tax=Pocillopora meandrina TaxID=46732 RepID=A0AAU9XQI6_9CNID|nr:unnamed protein product [Pocillopora meandrina]